MKAIRGGIPVVFPQFGRPSEDMSQHGFARTSLWSIGEVSSTNSSCSVQLVLSSDAGTLAQWPHAFLLKYTVKLSAEGLQCVLGVTNTHFASDFKCHTLLHTYFRVPHIAEVKVVGFNGRAYTDKLQGGAVNTTTEEFISFCGEVDRVYTSTIDSTPIPDIHLVDTRTGQSFMRVEKAAFLEEKAVDQFTSECGRELAVDCVLWNQWQKGSLGMADMEDDAFEHYVCVEPGTVSEFQSVPPQATLVLTQTLVPT